MIDKDIKLYHDALGKWGKDAQLTMILEEMSELSFWICKMLREKPPLYSRREDEILGGITEEMADVEVMLGQLKYIFKNEKQVEAIRNIKKNGMIKRIESE